MIWTVVVAAVADSKMLLKVVFLPGGSTLLVQTFLHANLSLALVFRFPLHNLLKSWLTGLSSLSSEYS